MFRNLLILLFVFTNSIYAGFRLNPLGDGIQASDYGLVVLHIDEQGNFLDLYDVVDFHREYDYRGNFAIYLVKQNELATLKNGLARMLVADSKIQVNYANDHLTYTSIYTANWGSHTNDLSPLVRSFKQEFSEFNSYALIDIWQTPQGNLEGRGDCIGEGLRGCPDFVSKGGMYPKTWKTSYDLGQHAVNGSFENGDVSWTGIGNIIFGDDHGIVPKDGQKSLLLKTGNTPILERLLQQDIKLIEGHSYRLSFYYKAPDLEYGDRMVEAYPSIHQPIGNFTIRGKQLLSSNQWTYYEMVFQATSGMSDATLSLLNLSAEPSSPMTFAFDRVELIDISDKFQAQSFELLDQATYDMWIGEANRFVYLQNPFGSGRQPRLKGNDNDWVDLNDPRAEMRLIDRGCDLWVYRLKENNRRNYMFYYYDQYQFYYSYWPEGIHFGLETGSQYFQPSKTSNSVWIIPNQILSNKNMISATAATVYEQVPVSLNHCQIKSIEEYGAALQSGSQPNFRVADQSSRPKTLYVLSPWKDATGKYIAPQFSGADNGANAQDGDPATQMQAVDEKCGLYAYVYKKSNSPPTDWFYLYNYYNGGWYRRMSFETAAGTFKFPKGADEYWINPMTSNSLNQYTYAQGSELKPVDILSQRNCELTSIAEVERSTTDEANPRLNESWATHNASGATLFTELWEPTHRLVNTAMVDALNHTTATLLPVTLLPKEKTEGNFSHVQLENLAKWEYEGFLSSDGKTSVGDYVWAKNTFEEDPLMRPSSSQPAGRAWSEQNKKTDIIYGCGNKIGSGEGGLIQFIPVCMDHVSYAYSAIASRNIQGDQWTISFKNSKGKVAQVYNTIDPLRTSMYDLNSVNSPQGQTDYIYDSKERLIKVIQPRNVHGTRLQSKYEYDFLDRKISETTPDAGKIHFIYDLKNQLRFSYNESLMNRSAVTPWVEVSYIKYDKLGRSIETGLFGASEVDIQRDLLRWVAENEPDFPKPKLYPKVRTKMYYDSCYSVEDACAAKTVPLSLVVVKEDGIADPGTFRTIQNAHLAIETRINQNQYAPSTIYVASDDEFISPMSGSEITAIRGQSLELSPVKLSDPSVKSYYTSKILPALSSQGELMTQRPELLGKLVRTETYNPEIDGSSAQAIVESYDYDINGNIIETNQRVPWLKGSAENLQIAKTEYDFLGRGIRSSLYQNNGQKLLYSESPIFDSRGRVKTIYDQSGNRLIENTYDLWGRLAKSQKMLNDGSPIVFEDNFVWNAFGTLQVHSSQMISPAGVHVYWDESMRYEDAPNPRYDGLISQYKFVNAGDSRANLSIFYDHLSRLQSVQSSQAMDLDFQMAMRYADDGSILNLYRGPYTNIAMNRSDYIYNNTDHRLLGVEGISMFGLNGRNTASETTFNYDPAGRMVYDASKNMAISGWRNDDQLPTTMLVAGVQRSWDKTPTQMNFAYAGAKRIARFDVNPLNQQKIESRFYLLGGKEVRLDAKGQIRAQLLPIYGGAARRTISGATSSDEFMVKNRLGSTVRSWSVQSGAVRINMAADYDAWGRQMHLKESPNSEELAQRFTGKERDRVSGLDYFGARYYDSDVGYWLSPDGARQFANLYLYSGNGFSPLNGVDKKGNWFIYDTKNVILFNSCEMGVSCSDLRMSQFEGTRAQYMNPSSGEGRFTGETNIADISMSLNLKAGDKFEDAWDGLDRMGSYTFFTGVGALMGTASLLKSIYSDFQKGGLSAGTAIDLMAVTVSKKIEHLGKLGGATEEIIDNSKTVIEGTVNSSKEIGRELDN